jgi:type I restriction enzyme S subunit
VRRFKEVAVVREGQVDPEDTRFSHLPLFAPNHIESGTGRLLDIETAIDQGAESGKYLVDAGDVLYSKIRPALRKVTLAPRDGLCSADMYPIKPTREVDARFLFYSMLSEGFFRYSLLESARVAMPKINREALGECVLLVPSLTEQRAIADFLDRKTAAIDALIARKERLQDLLRERRAACIAQTVNAGLRPDVPTKKAGVPFLGDIPAHWSVKRLIHLVDPKIPIVYGILLPGPSLDTGVPYVGAGDVSQEGLQLQHLPRTTAEIARAYPRSRMRANELVYAIRGSFGNVEVLPEELDGANLSRDAARIAPRAGVVPEWLCYALKSDPSQHQFRAVSLGATISGVNIRDLKRVLIAVPPPDEQAKIAEHLAAETRETDLLMARTTRVVALLREYRQALITAAVTGRVDVPAREAA